MSIEVLLLTNGFFLSFLLFVLLVIFASTNGKHKKGRKKIKEDIKKIKDQINGE